MTREDAAELAPNAAFVCVVLAAAIPYLAYSWLDRRLSR